MSLLFIWLHGMLLAQFFHFAYPTPTEGIRIGTQVWASRNSAVPMPAAFKVPGTQPAEYLYTWEDAKKIAASTPGWRLPDTADWRKLEKYLGSPDSEARLANRSGGAKLKSYPGFNVFPGQVAGGKLQFAGERAYFWTASSTKGQDGHTYVFVKGIFKAGDKKDVIYDHATSADPKYDMRLSVRLIKE